MMDHEGGGVSKCATETVTWTLPANTVAVVREVAAAYGVNDAVAAGALLILAQSISHAIGRTSAMLAALGREANPEAASNAVRH